MKRFVDVFKSPCCVCDEKFECVNYGCKLYHDWLRNGQDVATVLHGRWVHGKIYEDIGVRCSCCDFLIWTFEEFEDAKDDELDRFCPHCGAKMDEVSE